MGPIPNYIYYTDGHEGTRQTEGANKIVTGLGWMEFSCWG